MSSAMKIYELSASMAGVDKTASTVRFKLADNATIDLNNPVTIPSTGVTRSFTKKIRLYCATAPSVQVDNLRLYADGANDFGTGVTVNASNVGGTYAANATAALANGTDLFGFTTGAPMNLDAIHPTAVTATGFCGDLCAMQMVVATTASSGELSNETVTISFDEI